MKIEFCPKSMVRRLLIVVGILLFANIAGIVFRLGFDRDRVFGLVPLFDFDTEQNIPTLFSSMILGLAAFVLYLIATGHKKRGDAHSCWLRFSAVFVFLCIDESVELHERLSKYGHKIFGSSLSFSFGWMIFYEIGLAILLFFCAKFLFQLPRKTFFRFALSGILFLAGAIGFETISARSQEIFGNSEPLTKAILYTCEEFLEMTGVICFINALLIYANETFGSPSIGLGAND
ncbi:MAG: hypothetical protein ACI97A_000351 [Planctomycetota bacterium]|jgi:hypothetical protein